MTGKKSDWKNRGADISEHLPTGVFYVRKSFKRLKIPNLFKSTGETQLFKAKAKAPGIIKAHVDLYFYKARTVSQVIDEFLKVETPNPKKRRLSTQENHKVYFKQLDAELGGVAIAGIDELVWSDWLSGFMRRKNRKTYNDYAVYMNMLLRYAYKRRYITHLIKLPFTDEIRESGRVFTKEELSALKGVMNDTTKIQFLLSYTCGMRLREALSLTWDRVNFDTGVITLRKDDVKTGRKTGKGRSFVATAEVLSRLKARFLAQGNTSPFVFPSRGDKEKPQDNNKKAWELAKKAAGIKGRARWHDLRHSAASHLLLVEKKDITMVSEYLGVSVRTLQRVYLHSTAEQTKEVAVLKID